MEEKFSYTGDDVPLIVTTGDKMTPANKKPEDKTQKIALFIPVWVQIIICLGGVLTAMVSSPLIIEKLFPTPTPGPAVVAPTVLVDVPINIASVDTRLQSATAVPSLCCLAGWDIFSTDSMPVTPSPLGDCPNIGVDELGIHSSNCNLIFGKDNVKRSGVYGLSMPIQHNITIQLSVSVTNLIEGEFWVGFSNGSDPQSGSLIYAMTPDPGGISVYLNDISSPLARYRWADMGTDISWARGQPWRYNFTIKLDGNKASVVVNSVSFTTMTAPSTDRLFLGYHSKPQQIGCYVDAIISGLTITNNP
jgi:hypothetical protein